MGAAGCGLQREAESGWSFIGGGGASLVDLGLQHFARMAGVAGKPADRERTQAVEAPRSCLHHLALASLPASSPLRLEGRSGEPPCRDEDEALDPCMAVTHAHVRAPLYASEPPLLCPRPKVNNQRRAV